MNAIFKSKSTRLLSAFLAVLMVVAMLPVTAFAWTAEEGTKCTSTYGDLYLGSDGNNYYSKAGNTLFTTTMEAFMFLIITAVSPDIST